MKKIFKAISFLIIWGGAVPSAAAAGIMLLWNAIIPSLCGFASIGFWQAAGLFLLGQLLSAGFVIGVMMLGALLHAAGIGHHHGHHSHWHDMTDEQRREFIERRRQWFDMMHSRKNVASDGKE